MAFGAVAFSLVLVTADLSGSGASDPAQPAIESARASESARAMLEMPKPGQRQRRGTGPEKRGIHELQDPSGWPAEPAPPAGPLDAARFDAAVEKVCGE